MTLILTFRTFHRQFQTTKFIFVVEGSEHRNYHSLGGKFRLSNFQIFPLHRTFESGEFLNLWIEGGFLINPKFKKITLSEHYSTLNLMNGPYHESSSKHSAIGPALTLTGGPIC